MLIERVCGENFGPHSSFDIEMVRGLVGIFGRNGAGKSTFVNGTYAALTNDFSRFDGTKSDVIFSGAEPGANSYIEIQAEHEQTRFTLTRSLQPSRSRLKIHGDCVLSKANEIESNLRYSLGVDPKLIDTYVFVDQWKMFQFLDHTPSQRAAAYRRLCRTEAADEIRSAIDTVIKRYEISEDFIDDSDQLLTEIREIENEIAEDREKIAEAEKRLLNTKSRESAHNIVDLHLKLKRASESLETLKQERKSLEATHSKQASLVKDLIKKRDAFVLLESELFPGYEDAKLALRKLAEFERQQDKRNKLLVRKKKIQAAIDKLEEPVPPSYLEQEEELKAQLAVLRAERSTAEAVVSNFQDSVEVSCPTCSQHVGAEFVENYVLRLQDLKPQIKLTREKCETIQAYKLKKESYQQKLQDYKTKLNLTTTELSGIELQEELDVSSDKLHTLVERYQEVREELKESQEAAASADSTLSRTTGKLESHDKQIADAEAFIEDNPLSGKKFERAKQRLQEHLAAEKLIGERQAVLAEREKQVNAKNKQIKRIRDLKRKRKKIKKMLAIASRVDQAFHWKNLPRMVAQGNLVNMEGEINKVLDWFQNPFWVEADENLGFIAHIPGRGARRAGGLSGGQKAILAIAFRVAANTLFGTDIGMLWLDEPTAGLDEQNVEYFNDALLKLSGAIKGKRQIVVITHASELKQSFEQVIEF